MLLKDAAEVINRNYMCHENSLVYDLHETGIFSDCHFWEFYDSVIVLAKEASSHGQSMETAMKITFVYQYIRNIWNGWMMQWMRISGEYS